MRTLARIATLCLTPCALGAPLPPVIDGAFDDWSNADATVADERGDARGAFDVLRLDAIASGGRLALRLELAEALNLQSGPPEQGTLVVRVAPEGSPNRAIAIDMRARSVTGRALDPLDWGVIDYVSAPTHASSVFEMSMDVRPLGVELGDELVVTFSGADTSDEPLRVQARRGPLVMRAYEDPRKQAGVWRVCSINTLRNGALNAERAPVLGRLLDAMDPDIVCLQEEWDSDADALRRWIQDADPLDNGARWGAVRVGGNVILAPEPTQVVLDGASGSGFTIAKIDTGDRRLIVASVHLKCCGYAGSEEDERRIEQAQSLIRAVERIRAEHEGYAEAPFVLIGDWNLVGSGLARDLVCEHPTLDATDLAPMRLRGDRNTTWRDLTPNNGGFPPGRLDLAVVGGGLTVDRSFVFDTEDLSNAMLGELRLDRAASRASDHLMLVVDIDAP
ncbi:MAG: endonuclease/exonuclease/phosphatase family protein [Phycisphaerales bacterium]